MSNSPKIIFRANNNFAVNNKDNRNVVYYGEDKMGKVRKKICKDKAEYKKYLTKYICGFFDYSRNEEKAKISMFEYFMGDKKTSATMEANKMRREKMMMLSSGKFATDEDAKRMQKTWSRYLINSNIHQMVMSFNNDYIDENISLDELQKEVTTKIMPLFLKKCGYTNPEKNIDWIVSLHCDSDNYHFHIGFVEKRKCFQNKLNKLGYKNRLKFSEDENNFIKRQTILCIERSKLYTPELIKINKDLEEFKSFFNPKDRNYIIKEYKDILLEEKIIKLGYLISKVRSENKKYIKYNSLPKNDIGNEIRYLTKQIKKELFKNKNIKITRKNINESLEKLNDIFKDIDKDNNISNVGYEDVYNNQIIKKKIEKTDNYVLNAIVNHSFFKVKNYSQDIKDEMITFEDLLNEIVYKNYVDDIKINLEKDNNLKIIRKKILRNKLIHNENYYKDKVSSAISRLSYNQEVSLKEYKKIFGQEEGKAILEKEANK